VRKRDHTHTHTHTPHTLTHLCFPACLLFLCLSYTHPSHTHTHTPHTHTHTHSHTPHTHPSHTHTHTSHTHTHAHTHAQAKGFLQVDMPKPFNLPHQQTLKADPRVVNLHAWCPYFYEFGLDYAQLSGDGDLADTLQSVGVHVPLCLGASLILSLPFP
jgi:hypothetical protein